MQKVGFDYFETLKVNYTSELLWETVLWNNDHFYYLLRSWITHLIHQTCTQITCCYWRQIYPRRMRTVNIQNVQKKSSRFRNTSEKGMSILNQVLEPCALTQNCKVPKNIRRFFLSTCVVVEHKLCRWHCYVTVSRVRTCPHVKYIYTYYSMCMLNII